MCTSLRQALSDLLTLFFFFQRPQHIEHHTTIVQPGNHFSYSCYGVSAPDVAWVSEELPQLDQDLSCKHPPRWPLHDDHKTVRCFGHAESRTLCEGWDWHGMVHTPVLRGRLLYSLTNAWNNSKTNTFRSGHDFLFLFFLMLTMLRVYHSLPPSPWHSTAHALTLHPGEFGMFAGSRCEVSVPFPAKYPLWEAQTERSDREAVPGWGRCPNLSKWPTLN